MSLGQGGEDGDPDDRTRQQGQRQSLGGAHLQQARSPIRHRRPITCSKARGEFDLFGGWAAVITWVWIAIGSALGGVARYGCSLAVANWFGQTFPWGTLLVNILGSFIIGFFDGMAGPGGRLMVAPDVRLFVTVGICGGYTTFSSFSLQTMALIREGDVVRAGWNVVGSVVLCLVSVWLGAVAAAALNQLKGG
jgi:CrcB protein